MVNPDQVEAMITAEIPDAKVQVFTNDGSHFEVTVVSDAFAGKRRVQQHQMVYAAVKQAMATEAIHALALNTFTPEEWAAKV
ncbi:BolA/IbaG family iron-sulfur metabolism protein [Alkalinema sp. FACHB-956]|uniref:BolA/IbaG family iron-sulfur metabolism protein n=1 Tax=Alkalinema sp. FACHB-956 TaxID=2692768 RepID=UPI001684FC71|nr:BolA family transcriptional regulator [Alkalinema sp. FACHB-956]